MPHDASLIRKVVPALGGAKGQSQTAIINAVGAALDATLTTYQITTPLRVAHFLAQICHEADALCTTEEYADGTAYEGRVDDLGNTQPGDGPRYKGRGLLQLTGRKNYRTMGATLGLDLEGNPKLAGDPVISLRIACEYWKSRHLAEHADYDDIRTLTQLVNGGQNGIDDRKKYLVKAKAAVGYVPGPLPARPTLQRGVKNEQARALQMRLRLAGHPLKFIDGDFGGGTETALKAFQKAQGMPDTGVADAAVWAALERFV